MGYWDEMKEGRWEEISGIHCWCGQREKGNGSRCYAIELGMRLGRLGRLEVEGQKKSWRSVISLSAPMARVAFELAECACWSWGWDKSMSREIVVRKGGFVGSAVDEGRWTEKGAAFSLLQSWGWHSFPNCFHEVSIMLMPKPEKDLTEQKIMG